MVEIKLMEIQQKLEVPKNQYNKHGDYKFRSCEDILNAVKPYLKEYNCLLKVQDKLVLIGERYYIQATAILKDLEDDSTTSTDGFAREAEKQTGMQSAQLTGSTSSYARKYALNALFNIDDVKDADFTNNGKTADVSDKVTTKMLEDAIKAFPTNNKTVIDRYEKDTGKIVDEIKFIAQEYKKLYFKELTTPKGE